MSGSVVKFGYAPGQKPVRCDKCRALRREDFSTKHRQWCPTRKPLTPTEQDNIDKALRGPWIGPDYCNLHASLAPCPTCSRSWYQAWEAEEA